MPEANVTNLFGAPFNQYEITAMYACIRGYMLAGRSVTDLEKAKKRAQENNLDWYALLVKVGQSGLAFADQRVLDSLATPL